MFNAVLIAALAAGLASCTKEPANSITNLDPTFAAYAVWVINEGNFGHGNSTLDCYEPEAGSYHENVYTAVNHAALGDNANDLAIGRGDSLFVIVNNSDVVRLINRRNAHILRSYDLPAGTGPFKMVMINDSDIAITGFASSTVLILNRWTGAITHTYAVGPNPQYIAFTGSWLCVSAPGFNGGNEVDVIKLSDGSVTKIAVGDSPSIILAQSDTSAVVLCSGNYSPATPASLVFFSTNTATVTTRVPLPRHPFKMAADGRVLYIPADSVMTRVDLYNRTLRDSFPMDRVAYGLAVDYDTHTLYLSDAKDFTQRGDLSMYDDQMLLLGRMQTGVNPGTMLVVH